MRSIISIAFVIIFFSACSEAQSVKESAVPAAVVASFHKTLPDQKDYKWYLEDGNYEAEYMTGKMEASVSFDKEGNLLETEKEIPVSQLPAGIAEYVEKNYSGAAVKEASEITDAKGMKTYEAEIKGKDLVFDASGKFLKEEKD